MILLLVMLSSKISIAINGLHLVAFFDKWSPWIPSNISWYCQDYWLFPHKLMQSPIAEDISYWKREVKPLPLPLPTYICVLKDLYTLPKEKYNHQVSYKPWCLQQWPVTWYAGIKTRTNIVEVTSHSMIRFKAPSMRQDPYMILLKWLEIW